MVEPKDQDALRKVFDSFDKDKSGFIDISEIKAMSKELGHEINDTDVQNIFSQIDTNKDGKISFDEFKVWWHSGKPTKLEGLVYYWLQAHKLLEKVHVDTSKLGQTLDEEKFETHHLSIQAGEAAPKTRIELRAAIGGDEEKALFEETLGKLGRNWEEEAIVLSLASSNPEAAKAELKDLIETVLLQFNDFLPSPVKEILSQTKFDYVATADSIHVVINSGDPYIQTIATSIISGLLSIVKGEAAGSIHVDVGLKHDFASMLQHAKDGIRKSIMAEVIEGFLVTVDLKLSSLISAYLRQRAMNSGSLSVIPFLLKGSKVEFKLAEIPGEKFFSSVPTLVMGAPQNKIPSLIDLIELGKHADFGQMIQGVPLASKALTFFKDSIKASVTLTVRVKQTIATLRFQTSGIKETVEALLGTN